ncbi:ABC transporter permease [Sphaerobacter thermophilus]|uniref:Binding-protein-dependent transport systems inner membrane component n=1 Tax=Sphaerobacter thermophilus (strain ATCC 49802 / DSM 20745 / KCCM 41009 / NCIMB 13125 / S 6022) TaxID=479434 RepID=D1C510_SPHTD|nr:ABC transporter permease [Sphaerobacter thermophilus]ACZ39327.1 binding-protein-dependent transport systems inner membrane component [Sphaerobacter thermophilus DSM 20745]PZN65684.1 MAG: ABC transporter permease [Sphaerobacter thermophilus]
MSQYILRRLFWLVPTMLAISLVTFVVMHATPGSPLQPDAPNANPLPPAAQQNLARKWGLDKPLHIQYMTFLKNALRGDFGTSYVHKTSTVMEILQRTFPVSLHLGTMALLLAIFVGIPLGVLAAVNQNGPIDYVCSFIATLGVAVPNFVLAIFLIVVFVLGLGVIPRTGGWTSPVDWILPTIALGLGPLGILARYTRSSMVEVMRQDYMRTAQAKGLSQRAVVLGHAVKNGLLPPLTILGPMFAAVGTGSFFVETLFRVPGMGRFFVDSMIARDYPLIMAIILLYGIFLAIMNLVVDILYSVVDPRIRLA